MHISACCQEAHMQPTYEYGVYGYVAVVIMCQILSKSVQGLWTEFLTPLILQYSYTCRCCR